LPSVTAFYWFLTSPTNCLYMSMYVLMFLAAYRLRWQKPESAFKIPRRKIGLGLISTLELIGSILTIIFGVGPPDYVNIGPSLRYSLMIAIGNFALILPIFLLIAYKKRKRLSQ